MAVGMGDNAIKLWEFKKGESVMSNNKDKYHDYYKSTIFWKQLYGKIQSVSSFFTKSIQLINCL
jgi:hypothetical protein